MPTALAGTSSDSGVSAGERAALVALVLATAAILQWRYVGYQGSDDGTYSDAAIQWLTGFPALGDTHWALRYPVVFPIALSYLLIGKSVLAMSLVNVAYYAGVLAIFYLGVRSLFGWRAAAISVALLIVLPAYSVAATYVNTDMAELFFVMASVFLYVRARRVGVWPLLASGAMAGLAFLTRETTLALVLTYLLLFAFRPGMPRRKYAVLAAGAALIVAMQFAYLTVQTGDPFYRLRISGSHDTVNRTAELSQVRSADELIDSEGVLSVNLVLDPILVLFVSQKYALLFYIGIVATVFMLCSPRSRGSPQRDATIVFALLAVVWYLFISLNATILYLVPRYYLVPGAMVAIAAGAVLADRMTAHGIWKQATAVAVFGAAIAAGLLGLYLENTKPLYEERALVELAASQEETVYVDPRTHRRASFLLSLRDLGNRVSSAKPSPGAKVFHNIGALERCRRSKYCSVSADMQAYEVSPNWQEIERVEGPKRLLGSLLRAAGLAIEIPAPLMRKIEQPNSGYVIYRVPE